MKKLAQISAPSFNRNIYENEILQVNFDYIEPHTNIRLQDGSPIYYGTGNEYETIIMTLEVERRNLIEDDGIEPTLQTILNYEKPMTLVIYGSDESIYIEKVVKIIPETQIKFVNGYFDAGQIISIKFLVVQRYGYYAIITPEEKVGV